MIDGIAGFTGDSNIYVCIYYICEEINIIFSVMDNNITMNIFNYMDGIKIKLKIMRDKNESS